MNPIRHSNISKVIRDGCQWGCKNKMSNGVNKKFLIIILSSIIFILFLVGFFYHQIYQQKIRKIVEMVNEKEMSPEKFQFGSFPALMENNFFEKVKGEFIGGEIDFLLINLSEKKLYYFFKGELSKEYNILSIGKEGSFWETPTGLYQVEGKTREAFSSIGNVWMPYSLQFQGNFFIHGWPYYPGGEDVSTEFSGGCIRLSTPDAKEIFGKVKIGMPILIIEKDFLLDNFSYQLKIPEISGEVYLAADLKNNFVFLEKDSEKVVPIASIVKLMTALVASEYINLQGKIEINPTDLMATSFPRLKARETYNGFDLLYLLLTESSNEAAKTLARFLGEENFLVLMNKKAKSLGMTNTHFEDFWGGGSENISNAKDLFALAKYLFHNRKFLLDISGGKIYYGLISKNFNDLKNLNCFSEKENFVGGKTGKTTVAKETVLSVFEVDFKTEKRPIFIAVLGSNDSCSDSEKILNWIKTSFK